MSSPRLFYFIISQIVCLKAKVCFGCIEVSNSLDMAVTWGIIPLVLLIHWWYKQSCLIELSGDWTSILYCLWWQGYHVCLGVLVPSVSLQLLCQRKRSWHWFQLKVATEISAAAQLRGWLTQICELPSDVRSYARCQGWDSKPWSAVWDRRVGYEKILWELCRNIPRGGRSCVRKRFADSSYQSVLHYLPKKKVNEASYVCWSQ